MGNLTKTDIINYVEQHIGEFHTKRLKSLLNLRLKKVILRKNPYLFKAKNILTANDLIKTLLDAHLSSQEETIFGDFLEGLAIFICEKVYRGKKSSAEGIDLEFDKDEIRYVVAIKSGPNWGNSGQIRKMRDDFKRAKRILSSRNLVKHILAINGCCYGRENQPNKGDYLKYCGQKFWEFMSGNKDLYTDMIEPLGHRAKEKNEEFLQEYARIVNKFTAEFLEEFCVNGKINWDKLIKFNSQSNLNLVKI